MAKIVFGYTLRCVAGSRVASQNELVEGRVHPRRGPYGVSESSAAHPRLESTTTAAERVGKRRAQIDSDQRHASVLKNVIAAGENDGVDSMLAQARAALHQVSPTDDPGP